LRVTWYIFSLKMQGKLTSKRAEVILETPRYSYLPTCNVTSLEAQLHHLTRLCEIFSHFLSLRLLHHQQ
jgi:hypothetical protein